MNKKVQFATVRDTGDVQAYFKNFEHLIDNNSGIRDNRFMTFEAQQANAPFEPFVDTKLKLTDSNIDIVNVDKSFRSVRYRVRISGNAVAGNLATGLTIDPSAANRFAWIFVGFKSAAESINIYRAFWNGNTTECYNTNSIYEANVTRAVKPKSEVSGRKNMYSTYENAASKSENVCGAYIPLAALFSTTDGSSLSTDIEFDASIQLDDILPLAGMSLWPRCVFGDLELQIQFAFKRALVWCCVEPNLQAINGPDVVYSAALINSFTMPINLHQKEFTQIGDVGSVIFPTNTGVVAPATYQWASEPASI